jgi:hypothetical protein
MDLQAVSQVGSSYFNAVLRHELQSLQTLQPAVGFEANRLSALYRSLELQGLIPRRDRYSRARRVKIPKCVPDGGLSLNLDTPGDSVSRWIWTYRPF